MPTVLSSVDNGPWSQAARHVFTSTTASPRTLWWQVLNWGNIYVYREAVEVKTVSLHRNLLKVNHLWVCRLFAQRIYEIGGMRISRLGCGFGNTLRGKNTFMAIPELFRQCQWLTLHMKLWKSYQYLHWRAWRKHDIKYLCLSACRSWLLEGSVFFSRRMFYMHSRRSPSTISNARRQQGTAPSPDMKGSQSNHVWRLLSRLLVTRRQNVFHGTGFGISTKTGQS